MRVFGSLVSTGFLYGPEGPFKTTDLLTRGAGLLASAELAASSGLSVSVQRRLAQRS
jgi:hypothetical protein